MKYLYRLIQWIKCGNIHYEVVDTINGEACEIKYIGRGNKIVGYWAYGFYDPFLPFPHKSTIQYYGDNNQYHVIQYPQKRGR